MLKVFCLFACLCINLSAHAEFIPRKENVDWTGDVLRLTPAHSVYWEDYVMHQRDAYAALSMTALAKGCKAEYHDSWYRTPSLRSAIDSVIAYNTPSARQLADPAYLRYKDRALLSAKTRLSAKEWAAFERHMEDKRMLKFHASLSVLEDFPGLPLEPLTGVLDSTPVIWLKTYFTKEELLDRLRAALAKTDPQMASLFDRIKPIEQHSPADEETLNQFFQFFFRNHERVLEAYKGAIDAKVLARVEAFKKNPIHVHIRKAKWGDLDAEKPMLFKAAEEVQTRPPSSWTVNEALVVDGAALIRELDRDYPPPAWLVQERAASRDPIKLVGPQQAGSICSRIKNAKRQ